MDDINNYQQCLNAFTNLPLELMDIVLDYTNIRLGTSLAKWNYTSDSQEPEVYCYDGGFDTFSICKRGRCRPGSNMYDENVLVSTYDDMFEFKGLVIEDWNNNMIADIVPITGEDSYDPCDMETKDHLGVTFTVYKLTTQLETVAKLEVRMPIPRDAEYYLRDWKMYALYVVGMQEHAIEIDVKSGSTREIDPPILYPREDVLYRGDVTIRNSRLIKPKSVVIEGPMTTTIRTGRWQSKISEDIPIILKYDGATTTIMYVDLITGKLSKLCQFDGITSKVYIHKNKLVVSRGYDAIVIEASRDAQKPEYYMMMKYDDSGMVTAGSFCRRDSNSSLTSRSSAESPSIQTNLHSVMHMKSIEEQ